MARECYLLAVKDTVTPDGQGQESIDPDDVKDANQAPSAAGKKRKAAQLVEVKK